jgi:hypothetical protein
MRNPRKQRSATSDALLRLRKSLGQTQQSFATEVLPCAISTVARWETITPPEGEALDQLASIAYHHRLYDIGNVFLKARIEETQKKWSEMKARFPEIIMLPKSDSEPEHALVLKRVDGAHAILLENYSLTIGPALNSENERVRKLAFEALGAMQKAADAINGNPMQAKLTRAAVDVMANPAHQTSPTTTTTKTTAQEKGSRKK